MARHRSIVHLLVVILPLVRGQSSDLPLPSLPSDYFSGYVERIDLPSADEGLEGNHPAVSLTWCVYDKELELFREDSYDQDTSSSRHGTISRIEDWKIEVAYSINRESLSCDIQSLYNQSAFDGLRKKTLHEKLFSLNYTYNGAGVVRSVVVDKWSTHDLLTNSDVTVAFTRPGTTVSTLKSLAESPTLWQYKMSSSNLSSVMNFYDLSFDKPKLDVFDTSMCYDSDDYELLVLLLPGMLSAVDVSHLQSSIRQAISNYTGIYPLQIGNIKIIGENGSFIITSVQISNLTALAKVDDTISASRAVRLIRSNLMGWTLPFPVELRPGLQVFPTLHNINRDQVSDPGMSSMLPSHSLTSASPMHTASNPPWSTSHSPSTTIMTSHPVMKSTTSLSLSPTHPPVTDMPSVHPTSCAMLPSNSPLQLTITHTVTETVPCPAHSTRTVVVKPTTQPHTTTYPTHRTESQCAGGLSESGSIGLGIGAFAGGIVSTFLAMVCCVVCCNVCNCTRKSKRLSAGWRPLPRVDYNVNKEMDYFQ